MITHHLFKLGSPNLDHRCKRPWLRSTMAFGGDWPRPSRSNSTSNLKFTPFWACLHDNLSPIQARANEFGPMVLNTLVKISIVLGVDWAWHVKFKLFSKSCLFASLLLLWNICETCKKQMKTESVPHPKWLRTYKLTHRVLSWIVEQSKCTLVWPLLASQSSLGNWQWFFVCLCRLSPNHTYLTYLNLVCQHSVMAKTTVKQRPFAFYHVWFPKLGYLARLHPRQHYF